MNGDTIVERAAELIETEVDGDLVALDIEQGNCFGFNATASRVWQILAQPRSVSAIVDSLLEEFAIDRATCQTAVIQLIEDMASRKLVRV